MTVSEDILSKIKTIDFEKFPDPSRLSSPMDTGLWALWLLQDHFDLSDHFTASDISKTLFKRKIPWSAEKITKGFTRAGEKIRREKNSQGILSYMILPPGIKYLTKIQDEQGVDNEYFAQFEGGGIHSFFLLQVDLANHTKWFGKNKLEKNHAKKALAVLFTDELRNKYEFHRLFWAGDGGVFVRTSEAAKNYDVLVEAADVIYKLFDKWKGEYRKLETKLLNIRVCAHTSQIFADRDPGFWTSEELNNFIKYERNISEEGFAVTKQVKDLLSASKQKRFASMKEIKNKENSIVMQVFCDSIHKLKQKL